MSIESGCLNWDTNFFGISVAYIRTDNASKELLSLELSKLFAAEYHLIYLFSPKPVQINEYNSILVDKKRSYVLENPRSEKLLKQNKYIHNSSEILYDLSYQAGEHSRFRIDPYISDSDFKRLYRTWVDNSIKEGFADYVIGYFEEDKPKGLITAKRKNDELSIGLFATDKNYRGTGIGKNLIQEIINIATIENLKVEVTTQSDNQTACKFYEHRGFKIKEEEYVYHIRPTVKLKSYDTL